MRALLAIGLLILVAVVAAVTFDLFGSGEVETLVEEQVDIDDVGGKGPSFDVEMGSMTPGEDQARSAGGAAETTNDDEASPERTLRYADEAASEDDVEEEADADGALATEARTRGPTHPTSP